MRQLDGQEVFTAICKYRLESWVLSLPTPDTTCCTVGWKMNARDEYTQKAFGWNEGLQLVKPLVERIG